MKIIVFGNVGSGKTTILQKLKETVPFDVIAIDDFRREFGDGSKGGEAAARKEFFDRIEENRNQFIECIGVGEVADELFVKLNQSGEPVICIILNVPKEVCQSRLSNRIWDIPFPKRIEAAFSLVERTETKIQSNEIFDKWNKRKNTILLSKENIQPNDIASIEADVASLIKSEDFTSLQKMNDIEAMLNKDVQQYYGNEYLTYQKEVIERNDKFLEDREMISKFILETDIKGNVIDIGSGSCQWFRFFQRRVNHYFAIEANSKALALAPKSEKLSSLNRNIFDESFKLKEDIKCKIDIAFFSFFLSHFSDESIQIVLEKLTNVNSLLIIDSLWSRKHNEKYPTKELSEVNRKISKKEHISLPKRFFEYSDIDTLMKPFGYSILKFHQGNYWFACMLEKND
jgi:adenylate kinase family enzyme